MGSWQKNTRDGDLVLFNEMRARECRKFLIYPSKDEFGPSLSKNDEGLSSFHGSPSTPRNATDLPLEANKNDYDWLLTPPSTPLFPSIDQDGPVVNLLQRRILTRSSSTSTTTRAARILYPKETVTRPGFENASPRRASTASCTGSSIKGRISSPSIARSSPTTTGKLSSSRINSPMRTSSPSRQSTPSRTPNGPSRTTSRSPTPTKTSAVPSRTTSRSPTPTRSPAATSRTTSRSPTPSRTPTAASRSTSRSPTPTHTPSRNTPSPRRSSTSPSSVGKGFGREKLISPQLHLWEPTLPGFSSEPPPNLLTSRSERSIQRGGCTTPRASGVVKPKRLSLDGLESNQPQKLIPNMASSIFDNVVKESNMISCNNGISFIESFNENTNGAGVEGSSVKRSVLPSKRQIRLNGANGDMSPVSTNAARKSQTTNRRNSQPMFRPLLSSAPITSFYTSRSSGIDNQSSSLLQESLVTTNSVSRLPGSSNVDWNMAASCQATGSDDGSMVIDPPSAISQEVECRSKLPSENDTREFIKAVSELRELKERLSSLSGGTSASLEKSNDQIMSASLEISNKEICNQSSVDLSSEESCQTDNMDVDRDVSEQDCTRDLHAAKEKPNCSTQDGNHPSGLNASVKHPEEFEPLVKSSKMMTRVNSQSNSGCVSSQNEPEVSSCDSSSFNNHSCKESINKQLDNGIADLSTVTDEISGDDAADEVFEDASSADLDSDAMTIETRIVNENTAVANKQEVQNCKEQEEAVVEKNVSKQEDSVDLGSIVSETVLEMFSELAPKCSEVISPSEGISDEEPSKRDTPMTPALKRNVTLEEATDTILFCSSIVHELVYKAATIAIENKEQEQEQDTLKPVSSKSEFMPMLGLFGAEQKTGGWRTPMSKSRKRQPQSVPVVHEKSSYFHKQRMIHQRTQAITMKQNPMERIENAVLGNYEEIRREPMKALQKKMSKQGKRIQCRCSCCVM